MKYHQGQLKIKKQKQHTFAFYYHLYNNLNTVYNNFHVKTDTFKNFVYQSALNKDGYKYNATNC